MIKFENTVTPSAEQWKAIIVGCRNPLNSWEKSDSDYRPILCARCDNCMSYQLEQWDDCDSCEVSLQTEAHNGFIIGPNDYDLMKRHRNAGTDHRKFMRMITVYVDITAPLYFWKEHDQYKVGTTTNSCSTMHKIHAKEFTLEDFSFENIPDGYDWFLNEGSLIDDILTCLNDGRRRYLECQEKLKRTDLTEAERKHISAQKKAFWWQMIQLLPSSYNQKRTVLLNYEVLANMYKSRKNHKLDEWKDFSKWIEGLPYSELITGEKEMTVDELVRYYENPGEVAGEAIKKITNKMMGYELIPCSLCGKEHEAMVIDGHISQPHMCKDCFRKLVEEWWKEHKEES